MFVLGSRGRGVLVVGLMVMSRRVTVVSGVCEGVDVVGRGRGCVRVLGSGLGW